jgi:DNA-binding MarR family transcriptional regulator
MSAMETPQIRHFRRILRRFERVTNTQLRNCCAGVTLAQCLVLMEVDEDARLTVGQLASRLRLDNSTLSRTIDGLVRKGLLDRERDERDRRVVWIRLTSAGAAVCTAIHEQNDSIYQAIFERIPASKRKTVIRNFDTLVRAFLDSENDSAEGTDCAPARPDAPDPRLRSSG